jgi:hypothetical protein
MLITQTLLSAMNRDFLWQDITPNEEKCTPAGGCLSQMYMEANAIQAQIQRLHGPAPEGFTFTQAYQSHECGSYLSLQLYYEDTEGSDSMDYALKIEADWPDFWDDKAKEYLTEQGYEFITQDNQNAHF